MRYPEDLPVAQRREEILAVLQRHPVVVLAGETGSGKSTQVPKMLLEVGAGARGRIAVTQPRRVAAFSVSQRIAEELGVTWGEEVGCKIRFADNTSPRTVIKVVTDGVLLAEIQGDPDLREYDAILVDEAHERSLNIDFLLGYLRRLRHRRPDLRIVIASATLDTARFSAAFDNAPVLSVEGRAHPVEIVYAPPLAEAEDEAEGHLAAAVRLVGEICASGQPGDILIFLPGERDIREGIDMLSGRTRELGRVEILPLYARLPATEQRRIFSGGNARKIILATNVAETSLTIPGVRFVIDSGLARISHYRSHTRTLALPVEPVSQSSAKQRAGRAGRTGPGVCFRLYDEADFNSREVETPPEIARANLAGVILRMAALGLGPVEEFPFLDPPPTRAVTGGYQLLAELGAIDETRKLTPLGRRLARLPIDPTLGRMMLQAEDEGSLREVLVIAAALSVADPRERPADDRAAADAAHKKFAHPESDFLSLWNLWQAAFEDPARPGGRGLARFARENYCSFVRLREWRDLHEQLRDALAEAGELRMNRAPAEYHQVHRALLAGCLGQIAKREPTGGYRATRQRPVAIFPGSVLFRRRETARNPDAPRRPAAKAPSGPDWIVAAEWVETDRLYARTVARIDASWILDLGAHLLRIAHTEPEWDEAGGRVRCRERRWLHGLLVDERWVSYRHIDPERATDIFVRGGLVAGTIREQIPVLERNADVIRRVEALQARRRGVSPLEREERLYRFYRDRLEAIGSVADLRAWLREHGEKKLTLTEADLLGRAGPDDTAAYPEYAVRDGRRYALRYAYQPGGEEDGVTMVVPWNEVGALPAGWLDWVIPGYVEEKVEARLRGLPKEIRVRLFPLAERQAVWLARLRPRDEPLNDQLARLIREDTGVEVRPADWPRHAEPEWLRLRIEAIDAHGKPLAASRDLEALVAAVAKEVERHRVAAPTAAAEAWRAAAARWERTGLTDWPAEDPPEQVPVGCVGGVEVEAFPGLAAATAAKETAGGGVAAVRLFPARDQAARASRAGTRALWRHVLRYDLAWLRKELAGGLRPLLPLWVTFGKTEDCEPDAWFALEEGLFGNEPCWPLSRASWNARLERSRRDLRGAAPAHLARIRQILERRQELATRPEMAPFAADLARIVSPRFLRATPWNWLPRIPVWLEALARRASKASRNPPQDAVRAALVAPWADAAAAGLKAALQADDTPRWRAWKEYACLVEEYRVQVFAQELGTLVPVSPKRLAEERQARLDAAARVSVQ